MIIWVLILAVIPINGLLYASEFNEAYNLALQNNGEAQYQLAMMYYKGKEVRRNWEEASKWFHKSADNNHIEAQYMLGYLYENGTHRIVRKDLSVSLQYYLKAAKQGHIKAQYRVSVILYKGYRIQNLGIVQDQKAATEWVQKVLAAAENGNAEALTCIGNMYENGEWVSRNKKEAITYYRQAAEKGNEEAQYKLGHEYEMGNLVKRDYEEAVKWYRKSALQDNAEAQYKLGVFCSSGTGTQKDLHEALEWFCASAKQSNTKALNAIASLALGGNIEAMTFLRMFAEDYHHVSAISAFKKLAEKNNTYALETICRLAEQEFLDADVALQSFSKKGSAEVQYSLGNIYLNSKNVKVNNKRAFSWYYRAAEKGHPDAQYMLGYMLDNGIGTEQDKWRAVEWWRKAAVQGNINAQNELSKRNLSY